MMNGVAGVGFRPGSGPVRENPAVEAAPGSGRREKVERSD
jgi:hypothetical protein